MSPLDMRYRTAIAVLLAVVILVLFSPKPVSADPCIGLKGAEKEACEQYWTEAAKQRTGVQIYKVQYGDTLWSIAAEFGLDVDTLRYSNPTLMRNPDVLLAGEEVRILPFIGAIYKVKSGDTLESIARRWHVTPDIIVGYGPNRVRDNQVKVGEELVIPGGYLELNIPPPARSPSAKFAWPLRGWLTQRYSARHRAIDIATPYGSPVYAADNGVVVRAGWLFTGYGYSVILSHGNGWQTLYSHLKGPLVRVGQRVRRGQQIGAVGSTGKSTGPHVHFEVRRNGTRVNPIPYLPALPPH